MVVIDSADLERMVRTTFPAKRRFSVDADLGCTAARPLFAVVHGGTDPYLERQFDGWLSGALRYIAPYELLNRLCREGLLKPGDYAVRCRR